METLIAQGVPPPPKPEKIVERGIVIKNKFNPFHQHDEIIIEETNEQETTENNAMKN